MFSIKGIQNNQTHFRPMVMLYTSRTNWKLLNCRNCFQRCLVIIEIYIMSQNDQTHFKIFIAYAFASDKGRLKIVSYINFIQKESGFVEFLAEFQTMIKYGSLKSKSHLPKKLLYLLQRKPFKKDEKCFLFHLKSYFHTQDIYIFFLIFWSCGKNGLIRKIMIYDVTT